MAKETLQGGCMWTEVQTYRWHEVSSEGSKAGSGMEGGLEVLMEGDVGNRERPVELCVVELVRPFQSP